MALNTNYLLLSKYIEDIRYVADLPIPWERLKDQKVLITGATGLIGSFLIDVLMYKNQNDSLNCKVIAVGRNLERGKARFQYYLNNSSFSFVAQDINQPFSECVDLKADYYIHLASNT